MLQNPYCEGIIWEFHDCCHSNIWDFFGGGNPHKHRENMNINSTQTCSPRLGSISCRQVNVDLLLDTNIKIPNRLNTG